MKKLEDKVKAIKKFNDNFVLVTFNNGFNVVYEKDMSLKPNLIYGLLFSEDSMEEPFSGMDRSKLSFKNVDTNEPTNCLKEQHLQLSIQNNKLLNNNSYIENFNLTAGKILEKLVRPLISKEVKSRDWNKIKNHLIFGSITGSVNIIRREKNIMPVLAYFFKSMVKEIISSEEYLKTVYKCDKNKIYQENRGKDPAIIFRENNPNLWDIDIDNDPINQSTPDKFSAVEIIFPNGIDLNYFGIFKLKNMSKYNDSKYFFRPEQELSDQVYELYDRQQKTVTQWIDFEEELKKSDHKTLLKSIGFI